MRERIQLIFGLLAIPLYIVTYPLLFWWFPPYKRDREARKAEREEQLRQVEAQLKPLNRELGTPEAQEIQRKLEKWRDLHWRKERLEDTTGCAS